MSTRTLLVGAAVLLVGSFAPAAAGEERLLRTLPEELRVGIEAALGETHYDAVWQVGTPIEGLPTAWQAPNRARGMRTFFGLSGVHVLPMTLAPGDGDWSWGLELSAIGRRGDLRPAADPRLEVHGRRGEYRRPGCTEWFVNDERGLAHGFTVDEPPTGCPSVEVALALRIHGELAPELDAHGTGAVFRNAEGEPRVHYSGLRAWDAAGRELPSRIEVAEGQIALLVDDRDAVYPIAIDPVVTVEMGNVFALGAPARGAVGSSFGIDAGYVVIGAPGDSGHAGAAYVFQVLANGAAIYRAKLTAPDGMPGDRFGAAVALSAANGFQVLVGAPNHDELGSDSGRVYAFTSSNGSSWSLHDEFSAADTSTGERFGEAIAFEGLWAIVGSPDADSRGAAYAFTYSVAGYVQQAKFTAADSGGGDEFGGAVSYDGTRVLVGANRDQIGSLLFAGSAYVFLQNGSSFAQETKLTAPAPFIFDMFGTSVAIDGNLAAVGAPLDDDTPNDSGSAFVYRRTGGSNWVLDIQVQGQNSGERLGTAVSLDGTQLLVGIPQRPGGGTVESLRWVGAGVWIFEDAISSPFQASSSFGAALAHEGGLAMIGETGSDFYGQDAGAAHVVRFASGSWTLQNILSGRHVDVDDEFGVSLDLAGGTAVIGSSRDADAAAAGGAAYVFTGSGTTWQLQAKLTAGALASPNDSFGLDVTIAGDTIAVGAIGDDTAGPSAGAVHVFERSGATWSHQQVLTSSDAFAGQIFGRSVDLASDRMVVGAPNDNQGGPFAGAAYVFERSGPTWSEVQKLTAFDAASGDRFGSSVAADGPRIVVGSPEDDHAGTAAGSAYVFSSNGSSWGSEQKLTASAPAGFDNFGHSVDIRGPRLVVGAPGADFNGSNSGLAYLFERVGTTWSETDLLSDPAAGSGDGLGQSVALDGLSIVVGAFRDDFTSSDGGGSFLFQSLASGWQAVMRLPNSNLATGSNLGFACAIDGDQVLVGAPFSPTGGNVHSYRIPLVGLTYCDGKPNSLGCVPFLSASGTPSTAPGSAYLIAANDAVVGEAGFLIYSLAKANVNFHGGRLCVKTPFTRLAAKSPTTVSTATCPVKSGRLLQDFNKRIQGGVDLQLTVGQTVYAQWFQRDPADPAGFGDGLTNATTFVICP